MAKPVNSVHPRLREIRAPSPPKKRRAAPKPPAAPAAEKSSLGDQPSSQTPTSDTFAVGTVIDPRWARLF
jgi:hypothetical protein